MLIRTDRCKNPSDREMQRCETHILKICILHALSILAERNAYNRASSTATNTAFVYRIDRLGMASSQITSCTPARAILYKSISLPQPQTCNYIYTIPNRLKGHLSELRREKEEGEKEERKGERKKKNPQKNPQKKNPRKKNPKTKTLNPPSLCLGRPLLLGLVLVPVGEHLANLGRVGEVVHLLEVLLGELEWLRSHVGNVLAHQPAGVDRAL